MTEKTVKIRACVAVGPDGQWVAKSVRRDDEMWNITDAQFWFDSCYGIDVPRAYHWVAAEVPAYPEPETIKAEVVG